MNKNQIKTGAILSYFSIALNILAGLIYTPWMIKQIGESQYGLYTLANSLITLFLVDFGLSSATARYVSKYHAEGNEEKVNSFLGVVYKLYLLIDLVIFIILFVIYFFLGSIYNKLTPTEISQFRVVYIISGLFALLNFPFVTLNGILTSYEKFIQQKLADVIYRVLLVGLMICALLLGYGLYALVIVHAIVGIIVILYKLFVTKKYTSVKVSFKNLDKSLYKELFAFSLWTTVAMLAQRLIFSITPSILGIVASSTAIAIFGVISTLEGYTFTFTTAINGMFMPRISKLYTEDNAEQNISKLMIDVGKFQYALNGLVIVGFTIVGKTFIHLWVGDVYNDAYLGILLVLIPGMFFNALQIGNTTMIVQNKVKYSAFITILTGVINVILSFILSSYFGVIGACLSIFIAYTIRAILTNILYDKILKLDIKSFIKKVYLRMSIPIILTLIVGWFLTKLVVAETWLSLSVQAIIVCCVYLIFVYIIGLSSQDKDYFKHKIIKKE